MFQYRCWIFVVELFCFSHLVSAVGFSQSLFEAEEMNGEVEVCLTKSLVTASAFTVTLSPRETAPNPPETFRARGKILFTVEWLKIWSVRWKLCSVNCASNLVLVILYFSWDGLATVCSEWYISTAGILWKFNCLIPFAEWCKIFSKGHLAYILQTGIECACNGMLNVIIFAL